jgi:hypothetical protein
MVIIFIVLDHVGINHIIFDMGTYEFDKNPLLFKIEFGYKSERIAFDVENNPVIFKNTCMNIRFLTSFGLFQSELIAVSYHVFKYCSHIGNIFFCMVGNSLITPVGEVLLKVSGKVYRGWDASVVCGMTEGLPVARWSNWQRKKESTSLSLLAFYP